MNKILVCYFSATGTTKSVSEKVAKIVNGEAILDYTIPLTFKSGEYKLTCVFGHKIYERMDGNTTLTIVKE